MKRIVTVVLLAPALLTGCAGSIPPSARLIEPAPLPRFSPGDTFRFNNGQADRVVAVSGDRVDWRTNDGSFVTTRNVLLPAISWTNPEDSGERQLSARPGTLFPLEPGESAVFSATRTDRDRRTGRSRSIHEVWNCEVPGAATVDTGAGPVSAYKIACEVRSSDGTALTRTSYYAPALGYVVRIDNGDNRSVLRSFTTGDPALAVSAQWTRQRAIQTALTGSLSGDAVNWVDTTSDASGVVEPVRTVRTDAYGWCRDYRERLITDGRRYTLLGTACHGPNRWQLVDVRPATQGAG